MSLAQIGASQFPDPPQALAHSLPKTALLQAKASF
jgi:hypothetical protein